MTASPGTSYFTDARQMQDNETLKQYPISSHEMYATEMIHSRSDVQSLHVLNFRYKYLQKYTESIFFLVSYLMYLFIST